MHFARSRALSVEGAGETLREGVWASPPLGADWPGLGSWASLSTALPRGLPQGSSPVGAAFFPMCVPSPFSRLCFALRWHGLEQSAGPGLQRSLLSAPSSVTPAHGDTPSHPRTVAPSAPGGHLGSHVPRLRPTASKAPPPTWPAAWP